MFRLVSLDHIEKLNFQTEFHSLVTNIIALEDKNYFCFKMLKFYFFNI